MLLDIAGLFSSPRRIDGEVNRKLETGITLRSTNRLYDERSHCLMVFDLLQH